MKRTNNKGFSLIELLVVIAIMAILAGVAVAGYSVYMKEANKAADDNIIATMNRAFATACAEKGVVATDVATGTVTMDEDGSYGSFTSTGLDAAIITTFENILGANKDIALKYYTGISFANGVFSGNENRTFDFAGSTIILNSKDVEILSGNNAFSDLGSAALLNEVGNLEKLLETGAGEDILTEIKQSDAFLWALGGYAGMVQGDDESDDQYLDRVAAYMEDPGNADAVYSAQVMYAASSASNATDSQINDLFTYVEGQGLTGRIEGDTEAETMTNAALAYGMYIAYAQRNDIDTTDVANFTNCVNSKEFADYVASGEGQSDLAAYQAAMNMIGDNTSNSEITSSILENGIAGNDALKDLMQQVMGK